MPKNSDKKSKKAKTAAEKKPKAETKKAEEKRKKSGAGFIAKEAKAVVKKEAAVKEIVEKAVTESEVRQPKFLKPDRYFEAVGRRKTAVARVRLYTKPGDFLVNEKLYSVYFPTVELQKIVEDSLQKMKLLGRFRVSIKALGGGLHAQAEAVRHGLARCLIKFNPDFRKRLKRAGFLRRDPRMKERKKFGLKGARKAPQWAKR